MLGASMLPLGSLVNHYRIMSKLGEGGMGVVFAAVHIHTEDRAAIKVLTPDAARIPEIVQRFHNEAKAAAKLKHRNIVRVLDSGRASADPEAPWYIALEFLDGVPLTRLIAAGPMDLTTTIKLIGQACAALQCAHDHGIVHRDVKPDNLFIVGIGIPDADEHVKLLDFGIAKVRAELAGLQTKSHVRMGTPAYMAPEQLRDSKKVDGRADVYALGVITYEMLTGVRPWGDELNEIGIHEVQTTQRHLLDPRNAPIPVGATPPSIPEPVAQVVLSALDPDPERRWRAPRDFALALARAAPGTAWSSDATEILRDHAPDLFKVGQHDETAGRPLPSEPSVRPAAVPTAPARPALLAQPTVRAPGVPTPAMPGLGVSAPPHTPVPVAAAMPTTLGSAAAQAITGPSTTSRSRSAVVAIGIGGVAAVATLAIALALGRDDESPSAPAGAARSASPPVPTPAEPTTSALAVTTDPSGATVFVDGVLVGPSPVNVPVPVDAEVTVRAELAGYAPSVQRVRVGRTPAAVPLSLAAVAVDAGVPPDADDPVKMRSTSRGRRSSRTAPGPTSSGVGSGSAEPTPAYNPDDIPD